jgi:hypothetical protein
MQQRHRKHLILKKMDNPSWEYYMDSATISTRFIKPCKSYSSWCSDCNSRLFRQVMGRFARNNTELNAFEDEQRAKDTPNL